MEAERFDGASIYDVIIAGAGPVGLFLACELRRAKLSVLVLEQAEDPHSPLKKLPFGMRGLWGPSLEAFHRRGLLEAIAGAKTGAPQAPFNPASKDATRTRPAGHFAGIQFDFANIDASRWTYRVPGPSDTQLASEMEHIERVLTEHALAAGVEIRRGQGVTRFEADDHEVRVTASPDEHVLGSGASPGRDEHLRARWLVGCDGGRSTVRKQGGFDFVGTDPEFTGYSIEIELEDASMLPLGRHWSESGMYTQWQPGVFAMVDFDGGAFHRSAITREHVQTILRRVSGVDVTITTLHLASTWTDRSHQATTYRNGRVLLAGDAAHIHSPLGGQGLNLGLGDAMNLGWKLAATIHGTAPDGLLDSYTAERHPVGARILDWTRAQVTLMRPSPQAHALQAIVRDLIATRDGATYFAERVWGVTLGYDFGEPHPLAGRSCPDLELTLGSEETRVGALLRAGTGLLLDLDPARPLQTLAGRWGDQVRYVAADAKEALGLRALLVRPDGFVAWATDAIQHGPDFVEVTRAAEKWFTTR